MSELDPNALAACPFCGAKAWLRDDRPNDTWIECDDCQIGTPHGTFEDAIAAWNRRPVPGEVVAWQHRGRRGSGGGWSGWRDGRNQTFDTAEGDEFEERALAPQAAATEAAVKERDEALARVEELESYGETVAAEFEGDCWKVLRKLLDKCHFDWSWNDEGVRADEAFEHISTTLEEMDKSEARQRARADALQAEVDRLSAWQPIETALKVKDETVLLRVEHINYAIAPASDKALWEEVVTAYWTDFNNGGWVWHGLAGTPTHWRPLPAPRPSNEGEPTT